MSRNKPIFTHPDLLRETPKVASVTKNQQVESKRVAKAIGSYISSGSSKIIAYLGPFGSGKSVILNSVFDANNKKGDKKKYIPVDFDVWQYSDDKQAWDSFVITTVVALTGRDRSDIVDEIDGSVVKNKCVKWFLDHKITTLFTLLVAYVVIALIVWALFKSTDFPRAFLIYAFSTFFTIAALFGITNLFPKDKGNLTRTFQYEDLLLESIACADKPVVVAVEDTDRAHTTSFLESLHVFLQNNGLAHPMIVICPQKAGSFGSTEKPGDGILQSTNIDKLEESIKVYDDVINSQLSRNVSVKDVETLLGRLGNKDPKFLDLVRKLYGLANRESLLTFRAVKFILREVYDFCSRYPNSSAYLALICCASRYIISGNNVSNFRLSNMLLSIKEFTYGNINKPRRDVVDLVFYAVDIDVNTLRNEFGALIVTVRYDDIDEECRIDRTESENSRQYYSGRPPKKNLHLTIVVDDKYRRMIY